MNYTAVKPFAFLKLSCVLLLLYFITRLGFFIANYSYFAGTGISSLLQLCFYGIRFDISAIIACNALYILVYFSPIVYNKVVSLLLKLIFITTNSIALLANCADLGYYKFTLKRTTFDVFKTMEGNGDLFRLLPAFLVDFWYVFLIWLVLVLVLVKFYQLINPSGALSRFYSRSVFFIQLTEFFVFAGLSVLGFRGGTQLVPIYNVTAAMYADANHIPIVLNTPFSIIKTADLPEISEKKYFDPTETDKLCPVIHNGYTGTFEKKNVVIIILESFSKEYIGFYNKGKGYTPFLDSLLGVSLEFEQMYSNGKKSAEGIPAVVAGIPSLMNEPYLTSIYGSNAVESIASLLKKEGYTSGFYHGGTNGTMGFMEFSHIAGFDAYFGRKEYQNEKDYDGHWGIWDEPFLNYFANQLNQSKQPFVNCLFTLSSHHPFLLPEKYQGVFQDKGDPILKCVRYTDHALKLFFNSIRDKSWYSNTVFIITADHTGPASSPYYGCATGNFAIPLLFFDPGATLKGKNYRITQQIDIVPSLLDYLHYPHPYFAFGNSVFDSTSSHFAINYFNNLYQYTTDSIFIQFDGNKPTAIYNYRKDSLLTDNKIATTNNKNNLYVSQLKAFIQTYNHRLIENKMH